MPYPDMHGSFKSQSAMEYLMTYGWAILIIAVVLGALFSLGVFSSASLVPRAQPGNCRIVRLAGMANLEGICQGEMPQFVGQFNGQSSYVQAAHISQYDTNYVTVSAWINPTIVNSWSQASVVTCYEGGAYKWKIGLTNLGTARFDVYSSQSSYMSAAGSSLTPGTWYHLVGTYDGSHVIVYVNGAFVASQSLSGTLQNVQNPIKIGWDDVNSRYFQGGIADVQVYNTSLDANQVNALYMEGIGGAPIDPYHIVGWWPLNGDENDYSGNGNAGTPTNVVFNSQWMPGYTQP